MQDRKCTPCLWLGRGGPILNGTPPNVHRPLIAMSDLTVLHVVPNGSGWAVKRRGNSEAARLAPTREGAFDYAERIAMREAPARIVLHSDNGAIESQMMVDETPRMDWLAVLTSPPVLSGIAGALIVSAAAGLFAYRR